MTIEPRINKFGFNTILFHSHDATLLFIKTYTMTTLELLMNDWGGVDAHAQKYRLTTHPNLLSDR